MLSCTHRAMGLVCRLAHAALARAHTVWFCFHRKLENSERPVIIHSEVTVGHRHTKQVTQRYRLQSCNVIPYSNEKNPRPGTCGAVHMRKRCGASATQPTCPPCTCLVVRVCDRFQTMWLARIVWKLSKSAVTLH